MKESNIIKFVRICDITGKGMNEGWCWYDGSFLSATKEDTVNELRSDIGQNMLLQEDESIEVILAMDDDQLLQWAYNSDVCYWTEWYPGDAWTDEQGNFQFFDEKGALIASD